jgi:hypothetical protein
MNPYARFLFVVASYTAPTEAIFSMLPKQGVELAPHLLDRVFLGFFTTANEDHHLLGLGCLGQ